MKTILAILLLCSTADAGRGRCAVRMKRQENRQYENENGISALKWQTRCNRSAALRNFSKPFNIWGWLVP